MKLHNLKRLSAVLLLTGVGIASAYAEVESQAAQNGGSFSMPQGVIPNSEPVQAGIEIRVRIPDGEANLAALKKQSEALTSGASTEQVTKPKIPAGYTDALNTVRKPLYANSVCNVNVATGYAPSDIHGAVGPSRLVVTTNVDIGVYNKSGCAIVSRVPLKTLFAAFTDISGQTLFDPRTLYDYSAGRFFVTAESSTAGNTDQYQYFAVSKDSTASSWWVYRFQLSKGTAFFCKKAYNSFWDYPNTGKSAKRWFITANDFPAAGGTYGAILAIDKTPTLTGAGTTAKCFNTLAYNTAPPIVLDTSTQSVFLYPRTTVVGRYNYTEAATIGSDTLASATSYDIPDWTAPPNAKQPNGQYLDSIDGRFQSASIQSRDRIWNIHTVNNGGRPSIRWYRFIKSSTAYSYQTLYTSSTDNMFNPSFVTGSGIDGAPAFITASRTIPTCTSTYCNAAMLTFSAPNTGGTWYYSVPGYSSFQYTSCGTACRWGDYSSINVDPYDAGRAWGFNQLITGTSQWSWSTRGAEEIYNVQY